MIGKWLRALREIGAMLLRHPSEYAVNPPLPPEVAAGSKPARQLELKLPAALVGAIAPIRVLWAEPGSSGDDNR